MGLGSLALGVVISVALVVVGKAEPFGGFEKDEDKADDDETLKEILEEPDVLTWINRQNGSGSTLLHQACRNNFPAKALLLMRKGARVEENSLGEMPVSSLVKFLEEDEVRTFLETLRAEIDVTDFISKHNRDEQDPFKLACSRSHWRIAFSRHALNHGQNKGD